MENNASELTEQQKYIESILLKTGWKETTSERNNLKGKKTFSKKKYRVYFDYINTVLINKYGSSVFMGIKLSDEQLDEIFSI